MSARNLDTTEMRFMTVSSSAAPESPLSFWSEYTEQCLSPHLASRAWRGESAAVSPG